MNINREELDHIISQFSGRNMYKDMAMLFITQDLNYDDIFLIDYSTNQNFYRNTFNYIYAYIINKIDRGQLDLAIRDVFSKLKCYNYLNKLFLEGIVLRDGFSSRLIENTMLHLLKDNSLDDLVFLIDTLMINPEINSDVIYKIIMKHPDMCHQYIISSLIASEHFGPDKILDMIVQRGKVVDRETLRELVLEIFNNKDMLLDFSRCVFANYTVFCNSITSNGKMNVSIKSKSNGERREVLDNLRELLMEIMWIDAELEFYDFLTDAKAKHKNNKDIYYSGIYNTYIQWLGSKVREQSAFGNMLWMGYEEDLGLMQISLDCLNDLSHDICNIRYITGVDNLSGYDLFIRVFNLNRFKMCHFNNTDTLKRRIPDMEYANRVAVQMGIDLDFYIFLCFR